MDFIYNFNSLFFNLNIISYEIYTYFLNLILVITYLLKLIFFLMRRRMYVCMYVYTEC